MLTDDQENALSTLVAESQRLGLYEAMTIKTALKHLTRHLESATREERKASDNKDVEAAKYFLGQIAAFTEAINTIRRINPEVSHDE